jgi:hypothetical protein
MDSVSMKRAHDLSVPVKAAIESLLGRPLQDDEQVSIRVYSRHEAPSGEARAAAARRLEEHLERMAAKVRDVSEEEMEAAVDEAMHQVRPRHQ